ncbi:aldo/keto reductase [Clostridium oceanicum]|uniref:Aldo/keto reductase n=1 Tax=Clostridium oceanicum TaxID=1543 RepID=A0ABN1JHT1_9CLOT
MLYRNFGQTNKKTSILGLGCMRFPVFNNSNKDIDEKRAIEEIRYSIDNGINYIDTAYPYHEGNSEYIVGKALKDGYREKTYLATKLPSWLINTREDMDKYLDKQLEKLQTNYIDFYLLHALSKDKWEILKKNNVFDFIEKALKNGKIKNIGFSFHDNLEVFKEIVDSYDWDFCQIQYNYLDEKYQAGLEGLKYAHKKGMAVVIMEPLRGGGIVKSVPKDVQEVWDKADIKRTPAEWGLKFLWNHKEVTVVLSGMSSINQVKENIETANHSNPNSLTKKELKLINQAKEIYNSKIKVNCTECKYCMPCSCGIKIPSIFRLYNEASMFDDVDGRKEMYNNLIEVKASKCIECGKCEKACPQHILIRDMLKEVVGLFEK